MRVPSRSLGTPRVLAPSAPPCPHLTAENARLAGSELAVRSARVTADGPLARLPYAMQAEGATTTERWSLSGRGALSEAQPGYAATFDGMGMLGRRDLHTVETAS